jgi:hypothetical protein
MKQFTDRHEYCHPNLILQKCTSLQLNNYDNLQRLPPSQNVNVLKDVSTFHLLET